MADSTDYAKWLDRAGQDLRLIKVIYKEGLEGLDFLFSLAKTQLTKP